MGPEIKRRLLVREVSAIWTSDPVHIMQGDIPLSIGENLRMRV